MPRSWKQSKPTRQVRQAFANGKDKSFLLFCRAVKDCIVLASWRA